MFPEALRPSTRSRSTGGLRVNLLVNYGWRCNLQCALKHLAAETPAPLRLSAYLMCYADIYVVDTLWPDMKLQDFLDALDRYQHQDVTLGGQRAGYLKIP